MSKAKRAKKIKELFLGVYEEHCDDVFGLVLSKTNDRDVSLDITQDSFVSVWSYLSKGKKVNNLQAFLFKVVRNKITDYYRKKKSLSLDRFLEAGLDLSDLGLSLARSNDRMDNDFTMKALSDLSPRQHQIIEMRFVKEMSLDEIAFALGVGKNTISVRLHRALCNAREKLKDQTR